MSSFEVTLLWSSCQFTILSWKILIRYVLFSTYFLRNKSILIFIALNAFSLYELRSFTLQISFKLANQHKFNNQIYLLFVTDDPNIESCQVVYLLRKLNMQFLLLCCLHFLRGLFCLHQWLHFLLHLVQSENNSTIFFLLILWTEKLNFLPDWRWLSLKKSLMTYIVF